MSVAAYKAALRRDPCAYCASPSSQLDHIQPRRRGGSDSWTNLAGICERCNREKLTKSVIGFLAWRGPDGVGEMLRAAQSEAATWRGIGV
jgi:hypothetical protein